MCMKTFGVLVSSNRTLCDVIRPVGVVRLLNQSSTMSSRCIEMVFNSETNNRCARCTTSPMHYMYTQRVSFLSCFSFCCLMLTDRQSVHSCIRWNILYDCIIISQLLTTRRTHQRPSVEMRHHICSRVVSTSTEVRNLWKW